jgi:hypothetical protein
MDAPRAASRCARRTQRASLVAGMPAARDVQHVRELPERLRLVVVLAGIELEQRHPQ